MTKTQISTAGSIFALSCLVSSGTTAAADRSARVVTFIVYSRTLPGSEEDATKMGTQITTGVATYNADRGKNPRVVATTPTILPLKPDVTTKALLKMIDDKSVPPNSTLVFYYKGHGKSVFPKDDEKGRRDPEHHLYLDYGTPEYALPRAQLREHLLKNKPRLLVILTDSCATAFSGNPLSALDLDPGDGLGIFEDLFLKPEGVVDINAATARFDEQDLPLNQAAFSDLRGGLFTDAFLSLYKKKKGVRGTAWNTFFEELRDSTDGNFQAFKKYKKTNPHELPTLCDREKEILMNQRHQTPMCFGRLPNPVPEP